MPAYSSRPLAQQASQAGVGQCLKIPKKTRIQPIRKNEENRLCFVYKTMSGKNRKWQKMRLFE